MKSSGLEKDKKIEYNTIKIVRNLGEEDYYKPVRLGNFWSKNYTEYESNGDRNKTRLIEEYVNKIRSYRKDIINDLEKFNKQ